MDRINTVLFDLGNVLAYIDFQSFWRELGFKNTEEIEPFRAGYQSSTRQYETGLIPTDVYLNMLHKIFNEKFSRTRLEDAFASIILDPVEGVAELVSRISQDRQTALVSNTNEIHYKLSLCKFDVLKLLQRHYLSYQLKIMKPDRGFYDAIIMDQGIPPSEMLFIDDIDENVKAAEASGMIAIKYSGVKELEKSFNELGVL